LLATTNPSNYYNGPGCEVLIARLARLGPARPSTKPMILSLINIMELKYYSPGSPLSPRSRPGSPKHNPNNTNTYYYYALLRNSVRRRRTWNGSPQLAPARPGSPWPSLAPPGSLGSPRIGPARPRSGPARPSTNRIILIPIILIIITNYYGITSGGPPGHGVPRAGLARLGLAQLSSPWLRSARPSSSARLLWPAAACPWARQSAAE